MFKIIKILNLFFSGTKIKVFLFLALTMLAMILEILSIGMIFPVFSTLINDDSINNNFIFNKFAIDLIDVNKLLIILLVAYLVKNLYLLFFNWWQAKFSNDIYVQSSSALLKKYTLGDYIFFIKNNSSSLVQNVYEETKNFSAVVAHYLTLLLEIVVTISVSILLLFINFKISLTTILIFSIIFILYNKIIKLKLSEWGKERIAFSKLQLINLNEMFDGMKTIKAYGVEKSFLNLYYKHILRYAKVKTYQATFNSFPKILLEIISILIIFLIIFYFLSSGHTFKSIVPYLAVITGAAFRLLPSINRIIVSYQNISFYKTSILILEKEFSSIKSDNKKYDKLPTINFNKKILIKNFDFRYEDNGKFIFKNENFIIDKFDCLGIVGKSGAGKTTLIDLLMGLYKFNQGEIIIDGYKLSNDSDYKAWQKKIGYVSQKTFLIKDTIRKNIALGVSENQINDKKILSVIKDAQLSEFIKKCSNGLDHNIQEKGINISEGEKQRLGIARALYNNPELIILDEPTSSLDKITEKNFLDFLNEFKNKKTLIIISHKESNMTICNRVIKIDLNRNQNKIIEN